MHVYICISGDNLSSGDARSEGPSAPPDGDR